ncbi:glucan endo-1,3-beta-glucosidase 7-like [Ananas comosus]|uniref:Glucan endo-1,3-beta-glucosidase 7-like n=1 Tax=Ananas comosus TaxID=4615 RepID=A0A6P5G9H2_ANACO|nr:glucan endo-1,3-beta-glucosidase 7-like [Ananas comosus]
MVGKRGLLVILVFFEGFFYARSQAVIGVNYGAMADNLPEPSATARLLASTTISRLRLYTPDAALMSAVAAGAPNVSLLVGVPNSDVAVLASSPSAAVSYASANLLPFLPSLSAVSVGNEALSQDPSSLDPSLLLPAAILAQSDPPSSGAFHPELAGTLDPILAFLSRTGAPLMINPYPWFAYSADPTPETLAFCLFQPNPGRADPASGLAYANMFDAQVDAVRAALAARGFGDVADEPGATVDNARAYTGNLVAHLRSLAGTPRVPGRSVDTYLFALYDEDLKPGPTSERSFGLYRPDLTPNYDAGLAGAGPNPTNPTPAPASSSAQGSPIQPGWCVTAASVPGSGGTIQPASNCYVPSAVGSRRPGDYCCNGYCVWFGTMLLLQQVSAWGVYI